MPGTTDLLKEAKRELDLIKHWLKEGNFSYKKRPVTELFGWLVEGAEEDEYIRWSIEEAEIIKISAMSEVIPDKASCHRLKEGIRKKHPYANAFGTCRVTDATYSEGWIVVNGAPTRHAWNCLGGKYFDITGEVFHPERISSAIYVLTVQLDPVDAYRLLDTFEDEILDNEGLGKVFWRQFYENRTVQGPIRRIISRTVRTLLSIRRTKGKVTHLL